MPRFFWKLRLLMEEELGQDDFDWIASVLSVCYYVVPPFILLGIFGYEPLCGLIFLIGFFVFLITWLINYQKCARPLSIGNERARLKECTLRRRKLVVLIMLVLVTILIFAPSYYFPSLINDILNWGRNYWLSIVALTIGSLSFLLPIYYYLNLKPKIEVFFPNRESRKEIVVKIAKDNDRMLCSRNEGQRDIFIKRMCVLYPIKQVRFKRHPDAVSSGFMHACARAGCEVRSHTTVSLFSLRCQLSLLQTA